MVSFYRSHTTHKDPYSPLETLYTWYTYSTHKHTTSYPNYHKHDTHPASPFHPMERSWQLVTIVVTQTYTTCTPNYECTPSNNVNTSTVSHSTKTTWLPLLQVFNTYTVPNISKKVIYYCTMWIK